jgi:DNA-binding transcriptional MerR regulator
VTGKKWFKIGEAAAQLQVSPKELRYWERLVPEIRPRRSKGNLRYYHLDELPRLERIRGWLAEGLTVADCRQLLLTGQLTRSLGLFDEDEVNAPAPTAPLRRQPRAAAPEYQKLRTALEALLLKLSAPPKRAPAPRPAASQLDPTPSRP